MKIRKWFVVMWLVIALIASHVTVRTTQYFDDVAGSGTMGFSITDAEAQVYRDRCLDPSVSTVSTFVNITADSTAITGTAGALIAVCGMMLRATGGGTGSGNTQGSTRFQSGTGTTCQTGVTQLTGVMLTDTNGSVFQYQRNGGTVLQTTTTGDNFCIDVALGSGGALSVQGWINYLLYRPN